MTQIQPTKQEIEELIDRLGDKSLMFGCDCYNNDKIPRHSLFIGNILKILSIELKTKNNYEFECLDKLVELWMWCGFTKSLQEIYKSIGRDLHEDHNKYANELFSFLLSLFPPHK